MVQSRPTGSRARHVRPRQPVRTVPVWKLAAAAVSAGGVTASLLVGVAAAEPPSASTAEVGASWSAVSFAAVGDTYADSLAPTKNFDDRATLRLNQESKYTRVPYLSFDVEGIPAGATAIRASLEVRSNTTRTFTVQAYETASFDASRLTWQNRPALGGALGKGGSPVAGRTLTLDVSDAVSGNGRVNLALTATGPIQESTYFDASEAGVPARPPRLVVHWLVPGVAPVKPAPPSPTLPVPTLPSPTGPAPSPTPPAPSPTTPVPSPTTPAPSPTQPSPTPPPAPSPSPTGPEDDMLIGATVVPTNGRTTVAQELAFLESKGIDIEIRRVFDPGFDRNFMNKAGIDVGKRATHYSFKPDMAALAAGRLDGDIRAFLRTIPAGHETILTIWHEPEDNFVTASEKATYRAGWQRFSQLVREANRDELTLSWVMMSWSWVGQSGRNPSDWWPGDGVVDDIGIDTYNEGSLQGTRWDSPGRGIGLPARGEAGYSGGYVGGGVMAFVKSKGTTFGIAEFGSLENTNRIDAPWSPTDDKAAWVREAVALFDAQGARYVEYFHAGPTRGPWWLDSSPAALSAYAAATRAH